MGGFGDAHEDRAEGDAFGHHAGDVVADVGGVEVRAHVQIGAALETRVREQAVAHFLVEGRIRMHLSFDLQIGRTLPHDLQSPPHLRGRDILVAAEIGMREQGDLRFDTEQAQSHRALQGGLGDLLGAGVELDVGIEEEKYAVVVEHAGHRRRGLHIDVERQDVEDVAQLLVIAADQAGEEGIRFAASDHQGGDHRRARAHDGLGAVRRDAAAFEQAVVERPVLLEARIAFDIADLEVLAFLEAQTHACDARFDHRRASDQDRPGEAVVGDVLDRTQHGFLFAFGVHDPLDVGAGAIEHRLHDQAGAEDERVQAFAIGGDIVERARGHAGFHRGHGDCRGQFDQQSRIERLRNQVFRSE